MIVKWMFQMLIYFVSIEDKIDYCQILYRLLFLLEFKLILLKEFHQVNMLLYYFHLVIISLLFNPFLNFTYGISGCNYGLQAILINYYGDFVHYEASFIVYECFVTFNLRKQWLKFLVNLSYQMIIVNWFIPYNK